MLRLRKFSTVISENSKYLGDNVKIVSSDSEIGVYALHKPPGVASHPNDNKVSSKCLIRLPYDMKSETFRIQPNTSNTLESSDKIWLLNRLDSATSGIILCAENEFYAKAIKKLFADRKVKKKYVARVFGKINGPALWQDNLDISNNGGKLNVSVSPRGTKAAITKVEPIAGSEFACAGVPLTSLIALYPQTGFTHQLRVQCCHHNVPIVGEKKYGDFHYNKLYSSFIQGQMHLSKRMPKDRLHLHAASISFELPVNGLLKAFTAECPIPKEFHISPN